MIASVKVHWPPLTTIKQYENDYRTPPNFVSKTLQNRAQKVPNVPSETLEKQYSFGQGFV